MASSSITIMPFDATSAPKPMSVVAARDKSLTHRAIMFSALAKGDSLITEPLLGADCLSTMACFQALGVRIDVETAPVPRVRVHSPGYAGFQQATQALDCGNSGTTARLLTGILAAIPGLRATLIGDASLSSRPMDRVVEPLRAMGAQIQADGARLVLPLHIEGRALRAMAHRVDKASAQVKSALLLAGMFSAGTSSVVLPAGARDHTEQILRKMGASLRSEQKDGEEHLHLQGPFVPQSASYTIPVDPSSAAFFAVLGALRRDGTLALPQVLANPTRTGFIPVLERMLGRPLLKTPSADQAFIEPVMNLEILGGLPLRATDISAAEVPTLVDEIPILAVAAAFAQGSSHFRGLSELRVKESDRLAKVAELLHLAHVPHQVVGDDLLIHGLGAQASCAAFTYDPVHDHRLAMAAAVLAKRAQGACHIKDPSCVEVSFPQFFAMLAPFVA